MRRRGKGAGKEARLWARCCSNSSEAASLFRWIYGGGSIVGDY